MGKRFAKIAITVVIGVGMLSGLASAAQFSADLVEKSGMPGFASHIYVKDGLIRREIRNPNGAEAVIYRLDKNLMWILQVQDKTYVQTDFSKPTAWMSADFYEGVKDVASKKLLGTEKVAGYDCDKYLIFFTDKNKGKITQWISKKLNFPLKVRVWTPRSDMTLVYSNIQEKKLPDRLFELPQDFSRLQ